MKYQPFQSKN